MSAQPAVQFDDVTIAFGERAVLSHVTFSIQRGEFIGVLGPNGSGKTTLMRTILGLRSPNAGTVGVLGTALSPGNRAIGYMPQLRGSVADLRLTGWTFVASAAGGARWGVPWLDKGERRDVAQALDLVGAVELAKRPLGEISGGERQRLLLAQAILDRPKLLLLDEPLISLDMGHQAATVELIRRLQTELDMTVLFSAHELNPLLGALDRVLYLGGGHAAMGTVDEVIDGPTLSRLYGSPVDVLRHDGRIFVMSGAHEGHEHHV